MGADSCGSNGHNYTIYERPKLFTINDRFIIGCTGTFRLIDLLHYGFDPPKITEGFDRNGYMRRDFIPALRKYFKDHGLLETNNGLERFTGPFMVGFDAHLYIVQNDFSVLPAPSHGGSAGSGAEAAEAVLYHCRAMKMTACSKASRCSRSRRRDNMLGQGTVRIRRNWHAEYEDAPSATTAVRLSFGGQGAWH